jgi:glutaminyl-peptide cyclotransferase
MRLVFFNRLGTRILSICSSVVATGCCLTCSTTLPPANGDPPETIVYYGYEIIHTYPHDLKAFTQGLVYANNQLYEGTGLYGASSLRKVNLETGEVLQQVALPSAYFGEGIAFFNNQLLQITWKSQTGFVYQADTLKKSGDFSYLCEGWGITHDGKQFLMSDGTTSVRFLDSKTFQETGRLYVRFGDEPVRKINELEYVDGLIYANIWQDNRIAMFNPESGYVVGWVDLSNLLTKEEARAADVLNGIAWDKEGKRIFITGKKWPKLFEIRLIEKRKAPYPGTKTTASVPSAGQGN